MSSGGSDSVPSGRRFALVAVVAAALGGAALGASCLKRGFAGAKSRETTWYDATSLLEAIRPSERAALASAASVDRLEDLPLYDLELKLDPDRGTFRVREELWLTQNEPEPLADIQ